MNQNPQNPTAGPSGSDTDINLQVLARAVRKHWIIAVAVTAIGVVGALLYTSRQQKVYQAEATVQFDPQPSTPLGSQVEPGVDSYWSNQEYFATQHEIITSRRIAAATVKKLGLEKDLAFVQMLPAGQAPKGPAIKPEVAAEILRRRLEVEPVEQSRLAKVTYRDGDPRRAQRVLNALLETYVEENLDSSVESVNTRADWLDTQLARLKTELEAQEMALHDFKKNKNLLSVSYDDQSNMLRAEIQQLNEVLTSIKARKQSVAARLEVIQGINLDGDPPEIPAGEMLSSPALGVLRGQYITSLTERQRLLALGKGEMHPDVRAISADLETTKQKIAEEIKNIKAGVQAELDAVDRELRGVSGLYQTAAGTALALNLNELMYTRLKRSKDNTEKLFSLVMERSTESGMAKVMPFNNIRVVDEALEPKVPIAPQPSQILAMGIFAGLVFGLIGATSRELLDRTIKSAEDGEQVLGLPFLGALPNVSDGSARASTYYGSRRRVRAKADLPPEQLVQQDTRSGVAEAARSIRTNLMFMSPDQPFKTILVTSAGPAEGKTTVAACLAIAMAQAGQRVCLVDCDLRRPRLHSLFHRENSDEGLTSALLDPSTVDKLPLETGVENLSLLHAGLLPPNPAELLHSESFGQLLSQLQGRFDRVVLDSPPVGLVTDGVILSTRVDATVMIVRAMKTRKDMARRAVRAVHDVGGKSVGFVVNATGEGSKYGYTQYYYSAEPAMSAS